MRRFITPFLVSIILIFSQSFAQTDNKSGGSDKKARVMILGTFHFAYPNLDMVKTEDKDKIDVLAEERQIEIESIINQLKEFQPTKIVIEVKTWNQNKTDSLYTEYQNGNFVLPKGEDYQIGFRLAKLLEHKKLYCVDTWGNLSTFLNSADGKNFSVRDDKAKFMNDLETYMDSVKKLSNASDKKEKSIKELSINKILIEMNQPENYKKQHEFYFKEIFKFEKEAFDYGGADWVTASWYNRNLRIFRNIMRITENSDDRILVIYGGGHLALLSQFVNDSPSHTLVPALDYLKE
ncbi:MAG: hypothetical protein HYS25_14315 [Ignavibacteriales bacterium]|nr:hypothetical protein [Ignavibacteriales bacterium]